VRGQDRRTRRRSQLALPNQSLSSEQGRANEEYARDACDAQRINDAAESLKAEAEDALTYQAIRD
jgi:hypothetical protein